MKINYPFFEIILKDKMDKGHPRSMNIILENVNSPYLFHMEDDWKFFEKRRYITECINVLSQDEKYGQCLINKNYSELFTDNIVGGFHHTCKDGAKYIVHEHCENNLQYNEFNKKYNHRSNCAYWPHFSFRVGITKREVFDTLGGYDESAKHFEMEYAYRYVSKGYKTTFLDGVYCAHIGRRTYERFDKTKLNAYDLNNVSQFGIKNDNKSSSKIEPKETPGVVLTK